MAGMNSQLHITLETNQLNKLRVEAEKLEISVSELVRRKLADLPTDEELMELRKIKAIFLNSKKEAQNGRK